MAVEVLSNMLECLTGYKEVTMDCPTCSSEMAYSVLSHGFVCMESDCGFELEMDPAEAQLAMEPVGELTYA
jgi:hypothetical protein